MATVNVIHTAALLHQYVDARHYPAKKGRYNLVYNKQSVFSPVKRVKHGINDVDSNMEFQVLIQLL